MKEELIKQAVEAQANDHSLWLMGPSIGEAYITQSLRWLHKVIETGDVEALASILEQSEEHS